jgi:mRNA interferase RelE/StbE
VPAYRPVISPAAAERIRRLPPDLKRGVREAIRAIGLDPGRGAPLKRELRGYLKYKVRRFRIVYRVDRAARTVAIVAVGHRRAIYEEVAAAVRPPLPEPRRR